ncbi:hypothetical protein FIV42_28300 [Persicimonas caeni]|uniref:Uncharacterized protein n=1 Tax=Persicimonas caeni TaxID=2292766 RepID=A0A4Y6Q1Q9_PERCE|nr:hypothetical protein [Persicimonas caeni]QDG54506.1 hypothetical protein FIV42_28300 [Persicimonas caeni]QED35727.1 hypothetical protein FRD00_28295 [Persicimonas caeni]
MQFIRLTALVVFFAILTACAGGSPSDLDAEQNPQDAGQDTAEPDDASDASNPGDVGVDSADTVDDPCGVCCPGEQVCSDGNTLSTCADDGSGFTDQTCGDGKICEQGACVDEPICQPGDTKCHDGSTRLVCRAGGTAWRTEDCGTGNSCVDGECLSGDPNGSECTADADCAGGKCRCGSDESCSPAPSRTYCTSTCTPGSCGPDEICVSSDSFNAASYDHCVPKCNETCALAGLSCVSLPTRDSGELTYEQGCYFDSAVDVGEECSSATNCTGGTCLEGYFNTGLCTFECAGGCPDGTACVELQSGTFHCSPLCGDGSLSGSGGCPLEAGGDRWDVQCAPRNTYDGLARRVCVST